MVSTVDPLPRTAGPDLIPLAVGLDGVLVRANTLLEGVVQCLASDRASIGGVGRSLRKGRAAFRRFAADATELDPADLPYNQQLLGYLREQRDTGRKIGLFTAADQSIADKIAKHLGMFDVARGSDGIADLAGPRKAAAIKQVFGDRFTYAGARRADRAVFDAAERAILVGPVDRLRQSLQLGDKVEASFPDTGSIAGAWLRALRPQHWAKNLLVFLAPTLALQLGSWPVVFQLVALFLAMSLMASAAYLINDIADVHADRKHSRKRYRPFAAGDIPVLHGVIAAVVLALLASGLDLLLPPLALGWLFAYLAIAIAYSFVFKRQPIIDVVVLAGLFTLRVLAGGLIPTSPVSPWLLTFSMIFFLGLAMVKRYAELERVVRAGRTQVAVRGYTERDLPLLLTTGVASSLGAIIIFMIYMITDQYPRQIYRHPALLWAMLPLILVWVLRVWHLAVHGRMDEDPVVFALTDYFSLGLGLILFGVLLAAWS